MALKIVHLCDVHSAKGEDIPAAFAHSLTLDGGTYAVDLCPACDAERFMPLVAFMEAFGLLTDGVIDVRAAVAEDLRKMAAQSVASVAPAAKEKKEKKRAAAPAPAAPVVAQESASVDELAAHVSESKASILALLKDAKDGMTTEEIAHVLGKTANAIGSHATALRHDGQIDWLGRKWYTRDNIPEEERKRLEKAREIVAARDTVPRVCIIDGATSQTSKEWETHCAEAHDVKPVGLFGLTCPLDGETFDRAQLLGMHGRREHDCVHTPQLFLKADNLGDPLGIVADIRKRFARAAS